MEDSSGLYFVAFSIPGLLLHGREVIGVQCTGREQNGVKNALDALSLLLPAPPISSLVERISPSQLLAWGNGSITAESALARWRRHAAVATVQGANSSWFWADILGFNVLEELRGFARGDISTPSSRYHGIPPNTIPEEVPSLPSSTSRPTRSGVEGAAATPISSSRRRADDVSSRGAPSAQTSPHTSARIASPRSCAPSTPSPARVSPWGAGVEEHPPPAVPSPASAAWWSAPPADRESYIDSAVRLPTRALYRAAGVLLHRAAAAPPRQADPSLLGASHIGGGAAPALLTARNGTVADTATHPPWSGREGLFGVKGGELTLLGGKRDTVDSDAAPMGMPGASLAGPAATALREFDEEAGGQLRAEGWAALAALLGGCCEAPQARESTGDAAAAEGTAAVQVGGQAGRRHSSAPLTSTGSVQHSRPFRSLGWGGGAPLRPSTSSSSSTQTWQTYTQ